MSTRLAPDLLDRSNLTKSQLSIWTGQALDPEAPLYNMAFRFTVLGPIESERFCDAFQCLVDRCDALRTVIEEVESVPWQRVVAGLRHDLEVIDLSRSEDPIAECERLTQERCEKSFELGDGLFDAALYRLAEDRFVWFLSQHHIVCDAWASTLLYRHLAEIYERLGSAEGDLGVLPPQFADFVSQERQLRGESPADHWRQYRRVAMPIPKLYGRDPDRIDSRNTRVAVDLGEARSRQLRDLATRAEAGALTPDLGLFNLMATLHFAYVHRMSGQRELAIGAPAHNRITLQDRDTAGLFTEVLPLRIEIEEGETFLSLLERTRAETASLLRHARPGASDTRQNRGCNTVLNFIRGSFADFAGMPVVAEWLHPSHADREHHLRIQVHDFGDTGELLVHFDCNDNIFSPEQRRPASEHFLCLVDAMIEDWNQPITNVDLLSEDEVGRQVVDFNRTAARLDSAGDVLSEFAAQAAAEPTAEALCFGSTSVSYGELAERSAGIAALLDQMGATRGDPVAIRMSRSPEAVAAVLGILRSGRPYLPIEPSWPAERTETILEDAGVEVVLTHSDVDGMPLDGRRVVDVGGDLEHAPDEAAADWPRLEPDSLAYIIYTSGSTGRPKGVAISHRSLLNYVVWARHQYGRGKRLSFPWFSPLAFDLTVTSLFVPLTSGGRTVIYPERSGQADLALLQVVEDDRVDIIKLTPSHLTLLQDRDLRSNRVSQLILGGEDLTTEAARRALEIFGERTSIHNEYGPTEATVGCILHTFDPVKDTGSSVPIGRPITNMQAYVLDELLQPIPEGVTGELYLGGTGLASRYHGRPDLTEENFISSPFSEGERLYRTGDLARFNNSGELEYRGRTDDQVKIRGARVELGEIEAVLTQHPDIGAAVVTVHDRGPVGIEVNPVYCARCGLPSSYPGVAFDDRGLCNICGTFDHYQAKARDYFRSMDDLRAIFAAPRPTRSEYDCISLLSGGKDSTYVLCQLVDLGSTSWRSRWTTASSPNRRRPTSASRRRAGRRPRLRDDPGDERDLRRQPARHANVCQGCFKTIYTLSMQLAREKGIPFIVTGLSRGQFFETRLTEELFTDPAFDATASTRRPRSQEGLSPGRRRGPTPARCRALPGRSDLRGRPLRRLLPLL